MAEVDAPARRLSAAEVVRISLEREISEGILLPGDPLDEDEIAARFGVSRTPVREAALHLSVRGIVTIAPRAGMYVSRLSIPELLGLLELLAELEAACVKLATRRLTAEDAEKLKRVHKQSHALVERSDASGYARCNAEFHEILYATCGNASLAGEIAHIRRRTQVYRRSVFQNQARIRRSYDEHGNILEAMFAGDAMGAYARMLDHIAVGGRDFADLVSRVPAELLASEADYPGKVNLDKQRNAAKRALGVKASSKTGKSKTKRRIAAPVKRR